MDEHPEIAPVDMQGRPRGFGSRRHYTFSSRAYWSESARIVEALAERYGDHPALVGWQTDNEYGCHDTVRSWGAEDLKAFRDWLRRRYQSPERLNDAWGSVFWSMEVASFDEVSLPNLTVTEPNPAARLDYWRFQSRAGGGLQPHAVRNHPPPFARPLDHPQLHGLLQRIRSLGARRGLDFAAWDSYPIGFVEHFPFSEAERCRWQDTSHPDIAPFHHDLYRGVGRGRFWVMEQQPGPVNWARYNPIPAPGMVKLWAIEAHAHGAEVVSYFRWRQRLSRRSRCTRGSICPTPMNFRPAGVRRRGRGATSPPRRPARVRPADVALVYDYEALGSWKSSRTARIFATPNSSFRWYDALRRLGLDVDVVRRGEVSTVIVSCSRPPCRSSPRPPRAPLPPPTALSSSARGPARKRDTFRFPRNCRPGRCSACCVSA